MTNQTHLPFYIPDSKASDKISRGDTISLIKKRLKKGREADHLFTVNSLSGGRTSSKMAVENPADMDLFAMVSTDYPQYHIKDPAIRKYVWEKLSADYYATLESDETLRTMMELEQYIGREITWVCGGSFDSLIEKRNHLPNPQQGWCTTEMKIKPIFQHLKFHMCWGDYIEKGEDIPFDKRVRMNIGYRIDDIERVAKFTEHIDYPYAKRRDGKNKWKSFNYRVGNFPNIQDSQKEVIGFWKGKPVSFPELNNCEFCHKRPLPLIQKMFRDRPEKGEFWITMEKRMDHTFRFDYSLEEIKNMPLSEEIDFTSQSMCNSGGCTD